MTCVGAVLQKIFLEIVDLDQALCAIFCLSYLYIFAVIICCKNRAYITVIHEYIIAADRSLWRPLSQALRIGIVVATLTLIMQLVL